MKKASNDLYKLNWTVWDPKIMFHARSFSNARKHEHTHTRRQKPHNSQFHKFQHNLNHLCDEEIYLSIYLI